MDSQRKISFKTEVQKHYPKSITQKDGSTFKVLSKEPKGRRILGRGNCAWSAWKNAHEAIPVEFKYALTNDIKSEKSSPIREDFMELTLNISPRCVEKQCAKSYYLVCNDLKYQQPVTVGQGETPEEAWEQAFYTVSRYQRKESRDEVVDIKSKICGEGQRVDTEIKQDQVVDASTIHPMLEEQPKPNSYWFIVLALIVVGVSVWYLSK